LDTIPLNVACIEATTVVTNTLPLGVLSEGNHTFRFMADGVVVESLKIQVIPDNSRAIQIVRDEAEGGARLRFVPGRGPVGVRS
jgi:hypothetical protein